jgi:RTX calcium-binding nonapeptide repeat (4 copies)
VRRIFEMLNTPQAVLVALALFVVIDGYIYFLSDEQPTSSFTLSARTERTGSMTTSEEETNLVGTGNADQIAGTGGNDIMNGSDGDDTLHGNAGDDLLFGEAGADELYAGNSSSGGGDELSGGKGADYLNADDQEGGDTLRGGDGEDACDGDLARDTFINCEKRE